MYKLTSTVNHEAMSVKVKDSESAWRQYNALLKFWNELRISKMPQEVEIKLEKVGLFKSTLLANMKMIFQNEES